MKTSTIIPSYRIILISVLLLVPIFLSAQVNKITFSDFGASLESNPTGLCEFNSSVYFTAQNSRNNYVLWKMSNVDDFEQISFLDAGGDMNPNPTYLTVNKNALYFSASDTYLNRKLWKLENDEITQIPLLDYGANVNPSVSNLVSFNDNLFFTAKNRSGYYTFWKIDELGEISEINFESYGGNLSPKPNSFELFSDYLYFNATNIDGINTLWRFDGLDFEEINLPADIAGSNPNPKNLTVNKDKLYFSAVDIKNNRNLWEIDIDNNIKRFNAYLSGGNMNFYPEYLCSANDILYMKGIDVNSNHQLWKLNEDNELEIISLLDQGGAINSWPSYLTSVSSDLYFRAQDKYDNWNLWILTPLGKIKKISLVQDDGNVSPVPNNLAEVNGKLFFNAKDSKGLYQLWSFENNFVVSTWDGYWDNGTPNRFTDVIIKGDYRMNDLDDFQCLDLDILPESSLIIPSNKIATIYGNIINMGLIELETTSNSKASLINYGEIVNKYDGDMKMTKRITSDWEYISIPSSNFSFDLNSIQVYDFSEAYAVYDSEWKFSESLLEWKAADAFLIRTEIDQNLQFNGVFNAEDCAILVNKYSRGFNLVGNPYPSSIDWDNEVWVNKGNITNTLYAYSELTENYTYYIGNSNYPASKLNNASSLIKPMQAFYVQAKSNTGDFKINNLARIHEKSYFQEEVEPKLIDYCVLKLVNPNYSDETAIRFIESSTSGFDNNYDAYKLFSLNEDIPQIFSYNEATWNSLAINSQEKIYPGLVVPLGLKVKPGNYTILAKEFNFGNGIKPILIDNKLNIQTDLSNSSYSFVAEQYDGPSRFSMHFETTVGIDKNEFSDLEVYSFRNEIYLKSSIPDEITFELYTLNGTKVYSTMFTNQYNVKLNLPNGIYLAKINSKLQTTVKKIKLIK